MRIVGKGNKIQALILLRNRNFLNLTLGMSEKKEALSKLGTYKYVNKPPGKFQTLC